MERLTVKRPDGRWAIANNDGANPMEQMMKIPLVIDRLAHYEDLEEQGRLLVLPCKPNSTVFEVRNNTEACLYCSCHKQENGRRVCSVIGATEEERINPRSAKKPICALQRMEIIERNATLLFIATLWEHFGESIFTTREEAERALEGGDGRG